MHAKRTKCSFNLQIGSSRVLIGKSRATATTFLCHACLVTFLLFFKNHYEKKVFVSLTRISLSTLEIQSKSNKLQVAFDLVVNDNLGLMIRGGIEYGLGIFITGVDQESAAFRNGLRVSKS